MSASTIKREGKHFVSGMSVTEWDLATCSRHFEDAALVKDDFDVAW